MAAWKGHSTICLLGNLNDFLSSADFFQNSTFPKNSFRNTLRLSNRLDSDLARRFLGKKKTSGLIWVQTVCKGYQQTKLVGKQFNLHKIYVRPNKNINCFSGTATSVLKAPHYFLLIST